MSLFLHLLIHLTLSLLAGLLSWRIQGKSWASLAAALFTGFFIDLDHIIDYFLAFGFNFNLEYFIHGYQFLKTDKIYVLLHGWEYVIALTGCAFVAKTAKFKGILLGAALGMLVHLSADVVLNRIPFSSYSIIYRVKSDFSLENLVSAEHYQKHLKEKAQNKYLFD